MELAAIRQHSASKSEVFEVNFEDRIMSNRVVCTHCVLAHDLLNYVGIISGFCQLLAEITSEEPTQHKYVVEMLDASRKITSRLRNRDCAGRDHGK